LGVEGDRACAECERPAVPGSCYCASHLLGHTLFVVDRRHWPRLRLNGRTLSGDESWRPWLRQAGAEELVRVLAMLEAGT
jgi:hypothetical protein